jgi:hydrophobe/amphiphile efflux-1 (HAE1) family protein
MTLSDLSIKKPVFAWMLMIFLLLFGWIGFSRLGISQNPDVDYPIVSVHLTWEGASPEVMENEAIDPIEEAMMTVEGIKKVTSTARFGSAEVTAEFDLSKDIDVAVQEVQTKVAQAQHDLPNDMDPPTIHKSNPEDQPILWIGVSGTRPPKDIAAYVQDNLVNQFQTIPGVGEISLGGFNDPNLRVWLNSEKMLDLQLTVDDVITAIQAQHSEMPGGILQTLRTEQNVRVLGEAATTEEFGNITIPQRVGQGILWRTIRIQDIAEVEEGMADVRRISRVNGEPSIGIGLRKQRGANAVEVARQAKRKIEQIARDLPSGMKIAVIFDTTKFIEDNVRELFITLFLSVLFTSLVCWLFLGSLTSTLNVFLAIPTALGGTMLVILNTITLMAISLVIGIVVDDAIVVMENIVRHRERGESQIKAAIIGAREITFSVIVISSAVIAIFLPVAFMKGMVGKFFYQFGITVSVAVAFSLLEAITMAPMRCSQFLGVGHSSKFGQAVDAFLRKLTVGYRSVLGIALQHRGKVILAATILFVLSLGIAGKLRREMTPSQDQGSFSVRFQTAPGSSLAFTDEVYRQAEKILEQRPEMEKYYGTVGGFGGGEVNSGNIFVTMKKLKERPHAPGTNRPITQQEFMDVLRKILNDVPGMRRVAVQDRSQAISVGTGRGFPIELSVQGPDWEKLGEYAENIRDSLMKSGMAVDVDTSYRVGVPEVRVIPDRDKAASQGVTVAAISRTINSTVGGVRVGKYTKGGRRYDIRVSLRDENRKDQTDISKLWVRNIRGEMVPLSQVTRIVEQPTPLSIQRENRSRAVTVSGNVAPGKSQSTAIATALKIAKKALPENYRVVTTGNAQQFEESFRELGLALFLGIAMAYMILGAQFNSFIHPFTILLALPFSLSGALAALWFRNYSLNMMSVIGILLLMGIVKKNSILLVDFTNVQRLKGLSTRDALLEACPIRLRPILMTSFAIVAGALPSALILGPGAELRAPMGIVIIGGTLVSTLLTLFVVPCAYYFLSRFESKHRDSRMAEVMDVLSPVPSDRLRQNIKENKFEKGS